MFLSSPSDVVSSQTSPQSNVISTTTEEHLAENTAVQQQPSEFLAIRSGPISCPHCSLKFCYNAKQNLDRHVKAGKCKFCDKTFKCNGSLRQHLRKNVRCALLLNPDMEQKKGSSTPDVEKYVHCEKCNKSFRSLAALNNHQTDCYNDVTVEYKCPYCEKSFERSKSLQHHQITRTCDNCNLQNACSGLHYKHTKVCQVEVKTEFSSGSSRTKCEFCSSFIKSIDFHFGEKICKKCGLASPCAKLNRQHEKQCNETRMVEKFHYQCVTCKQWLKNKGALKRHQKLQVCYDCNLSTYCAKYFREHDDPDAETAQQHPTKQPKVVLQKLQTPQSSLITKKMSVKMASIEVSNSKKAWEHQCPSCNKKLSNSTALKKHVRFRVCKICNLETFCYWKFDKHKCEGKEEPSAKKIETKSIKQIPPVPVSQICPFCGEQCNTEDDLDWHARPTRCPRCTYKQPCTTLMAKHLNVCRFCEEKVPFACPICEKTFSSAALLGTHVQLGCGKKFWCHDCDKVFPLRLQLDEHDSIHHPSLCRNARTPVHGILDMLICQELSS